MGVPGQPVHGDKNMFCVSFWPCRPWKCRRPDRPVYTAGQARQNLCPPAEVPVTCQFRLPFHIKRNCRQQYTILKTDVQSVCLLYSKSSFPGHELPYNGFFGRISWKHKTGAIVRWSFLLYTCLQIFQAAAKFIFCSSVWLINSMYLLYQTL